jgi:hypothetical protein
VEAFSLNNCLHDEAANVALFKSLREKHPELATRCFPLAESLLVKNHEYALCTEYLPDPQTTFDSIRHSWAQQKREEFFVATERRKNQKLLDELHREHIGLNMLPASPLRMPPQIADINFISQSRQLIEILVGAGKQLEAERIRNQAFLLLPVQQLESAMSDAEKRTDKHS